MKSMSIDKTADYSTMFTAVFAQSIKAVLLAENWTENNWMPLAISQMLEQSETNFKVKNIDPLIGYSMVVDAQGTSEVARVVSSKLVTTEVKLRISLGTNFLSRTLTG